MAAPLPRRPYSFVRPLVLATLLAVGASPPDLAAQGLDVERITISTSGVQANAFSPAGAISGDGRFIVFRSEANNLVPGDTNGAMDVFVHDRITGVTSRVSVGTGGVEGDGESRVDEPGQLISRDGRYVVFESDATNLVPGDTNGLTDVFVHDRQTGQTQRASIDALGAQLSAASIDPHISADGDSITFATFGSPNLPLGLYVRDRVSGQVSLVSRSTGGAAGDNGSYAGYMSADGRHVVFVSFASNLVAGDTNNALDVFLHDRQTQVTTRANVSADVAQTGGETNHARISGNGRFVTFSTDAFASLALDDTNGAEDVWMRDRDTDRDGIFDEPGAVRTFLLSKSAAGVQGNAFSLGSAMNFDGRYVTITSDADNLLGPGQDQNGSRDIFLYELDLDGDGIFDEPGDQRVVRVSVAIDGSPAGGGQGYVHDISEDGRFIHFDSFAGDIVRDDTNGIMDSFVVDRLAWRTTTSMAPATAIRQPRLSGNGGWSVFSSADATLVAGDSNGQADVFVRNRRLPLGSPGAVVRVSVAGDGSQAVGGASDQADISGDGRFVVFRSAAVNLVPLDTNAAADVFLHDRDTDRDGVFDEPGARQTYRVSIATGGAQATGASETPDISADGRYIAFVSAAANLAPGGNGLRQVFVHERLTGTTSRVSERGGVPAGAPALTPVAGDNGTVAFATAAANLADADTNGDLDVYASVIGASGRVVLLVSHRLGAAVPGESGAPAISGDGLVVAFQSSAATLVTGDGNGVTDVFAAPVGRVPSTVGTVIRVSVTRGAGDANGSSGAPAVSADLGRGYVSGTGGNLYDWIYAVSFTSAASNLVFGDTNGVDDVFTIRVNGLSMLESPDAPTLLLDPVPLATRVSLDAGGGQLTTASGVSSISANGTRVEYERPLPGTGAVVPVLVYDALDDKSVTGTGGVRYDTLEVTGMAPRSGAPGSRITIAGTGLDNPDVSFTLGGPLTVLDRTSTTLNASTDPAGTGTQFLIANGASDFGKSTSSPLTFTYTATPACTFGPAPADQAFGAGAGSRSIDVIAGAGCDWALSVPLDATWIAVSTNQGTGTQSVRIDVSANEEPGSRRARLETTAGGFDVVQEGTPCTFTLQAPSASWGSGPQVGAVRITTRTGCAWTTSGNTVDWVTLRQTQGSGNLDLHYDVAANASTSPRSHTFTIAGQAYTVNQAGAAGRLLQITRSGNGRVTSTPAGIDCGSGPGCAATFPAGANVTLHAEPLAGATFDGWTGSCVGAGTCTVDMNVDREVGAAFAAGPTRHSLTVSKAGTGEGTVFSAPAGITCGPTCQAVFDAGISVTLNPVAAGGSRFAGWEGDCTAAGQVELTQPRSCTARFEPQPATHTVTVAISGPGRVTSVPAGLDCTATCSASFPVNATVSLIATPTPDHRFTWSGACTGTAACVRQLGGDLAVGATFQPGTGGPIAVTEVQPRSGLATGGTTLRIRGAGFAQPGGVSVSVGGVPATAVDVVSDTLLVVSTGAVPGAPAVVAAPVASVVQTGDLVVNVAGATASLAGVYRAVALTGDTDTDTDGDTLPDGYEATFALDVLVPDSLSDPDGDGASNLLEFQQGTHPQGHHRRYLAEGATGPFFDTRINTANPGFVPATVVLRYQGAGPNVVHRFVVPGRERRHVYPRYLPNLGHNAFSTLIESNTEIVADRSMFWPPVIYGSHAETSIPAPATTWYLAEGATGPVFDLFYLLQNPDLSRAAEVRIQYLRPSGAPIVRTYVVPPASRLTLYIDEMPELVHAEVSGVVEATNGVPIIVERAMYVTRNGQTFGGGHGSAGVTNPSTSWFLAEGATGDFFDTFVLIANPSTAAAELTATFMRPDGHTVTRPYTVGPLSRRTIQVDGVDPALAATSVATSIVSTNGVGVIVERAMYWPGPQLTPAFWHEAHNSPGSTETGTAWGLADGETGPPPVNTTTFYLVANTSSFPATVRVSLLFETGAPPAEKTFTIAPNARLTVSAAAEFPASLGRGYGAVIESIGDTPAQIVVERAMYSDSEGVFWAAGTNVLATRLR